METFDDHFREMLQTVKVAHANFEIWSIYRNVHDWNKYIEALDTFRGFFKVSIHSHFVAMLMAVYKLYDPRKDSASIVNLVKEAEESNIVGLDAIESAKNKIADALTIWEKAKKLRHKLFAHRDRFLSYEKVFKQADLRVEDFSRIIEVTLMVLNEISYAKDRKIHRFNNFATNDTHKLLASLKSHITEKTHT